MDYRLIFTSVLVLAQLEVVEARIYEERWFWSCVGLVLFGITSAFVFVYFKKCAPHNNRTHAVPVVTSVNTQWATTAKPGPSQIVHPPPYGYASAQYSQYPPYNPGPAPPYAPPQNPGPAPPYPPPPEGLYQDSAYPPPYQAPSHAYPQNSGGAQPTDPFANASHGR